MSHKTVVNIGPFHPLQEEAEFYQLYVDGETVVDVDVRISYNHRGIEKLDESKTFDQVPFVVERVCGICSASHPLAYIRAVEDICQCKVPERAEYLRVIAAELNRIASHCITLGCITMDLGAFTPFVYLLREREMINDLMEALCGNRLTHNYLRIGGVMADVDDDWLGQLGKFLDHFEPVLDEFFDLIVYNEILVRRTADVAAICGEEAVAFGLVGPNLRASGVDWDCRRDLGYGVYPQLAFEVPLGTGERGTVGDCFDRFVVRVREMRQSARILRQCMQKLPEGDIRAKVPKMIKVPEGEVYACVEGARGELGAYLIADGSNKPYRLKWRTGSFAAMSIVEHISRGLMIADLVAVIATLDVIAPETDR